MSYVAAERSTLGRLLPPWWLQLITGIIEVAWVAAIAILNGIGDIVLAFRVREVQHAPASRS